MDMSNQTTNELTQENPEPNFSSGPSSSQIPKISIRNLSKSFGNKEVLKDVSLDIYTGRSMVVIGGSGVGKSVLLKIILGLIPADSGSILIDNQPLVSSENKISPELGKIGMLFQGAALFDSMRVWENISFRLMLADGQSRRHSRERAYECLSLVGLNEDVGELYPSEISGGMQKRVGLARAIAAKPEILFFDEPTTGLDPIMADVINKLIFEQVHALGATAVSITHDMKSASKIGDEITMLHGGRIIWRGTPESMVHSGNAMVDQFINGRAEGPIRVDS